MKNTCIYKLFYFIILLTGCQIQNNHEDYTPTFSNDPNNIKHVEYTFGVHPLHNPQRLQEFFGPIMQILEKEIPNTRFRLEPSKNYAEYDQKLKDKSLSFALPNPYQTLQAIQNGYNVFAKMSDDQNFRGIVLVRKDSGINKLQDLKGKTISFPAPTALAAAMMPQYYIHKHGLNVKKDIKVKYVGSQESSILAVHQHNSDAAATWPPPWQSFSEEKPELSRDLKILFQTDNLPNNGLIARNDIPDEIVQKVKQVFIKRDSTDEGKSILNKMKLTKFESADQSTYEPVKKFMKKFDSEIGKLEEK